MSLPIEKLFYFDKDLVEMTGFTKRQLRGARNKGYLRCMRTKPLRYTKQMILAFLKRIEDDPSIMIDSNLYAKND
jgi:hypothetical protein